MEQHLLSSYQGPSSPIFLYFQIRKIPHEGKGRVSLIAQLVKNPPAMQETPVQFLGQEDLLEKG